MKKSHLIIIVALLCAAPTFAQVEEDATLAEKAAKLWKKTKKSVNNTKEEIRMQLGIDDKEKAQLRAKYMPIFTENKYEGDDADELTQICKKLFYQRFPKSYIKTVVIPTESWQTVPVERDGGIEGYLQTINCYVLAKDGKEGYINAEFMFQRMKSPGGAYDHVENKWPEVTREDIIPAVDFKKLTE